MTDINTDLLDSIESVLRRRHAKRVAGAYSKAEQSITSGELAATITGEDTDANPKTREAVRALMDERSIPVVSSSNGYRIPTEADAVSDELDSLDGRIAGIQQRKSLLSSAWDAWLRKGQPAEVTDGGDPTDYYDRLTGAEQAFVDETGFDPKDVWETRHGDGQ